MPSRIAGTRRWLTPLLVLLALIGAACSGDDGDGAAEPVPPAVQPTEQPTADSADEPEENDDEAATAREPATIEDQDLGSLITLGAGEPVEDVLGNLVTIHGASEWPEPYAAVDPFGRDDVDLFGGLEREWDDPASLVALDVAICARGEFPTEQRSVDFHVAAEADALLQDDDSTGAAIGTFPIINPGFEFPSPGACARGWVPVGFGGAGTPTVARYVLADDEPADGESPVRHVYQWTVSPAALPELDGTFAAGERVRFNDGTAEGTTITLAGWAELIDTESPIADTRLVAVSLEVCAGEGSLPAFGLALDGWNLAEPIDAEPIPSPIDLGATADGSCAEGWLGFAVPLGARPTGFFATDGDEMRTGFADWSLAGAALPNPL